VRVFLGVGVEDLAQGDVQRHGYIACTGTVALEVPSPILFGAVRQVVLSKRGFVDCGTHSDVANSVHKCLDLVQHEVSQTSP
jgi:hypothetical protein